MGLREIKQLDEKVEQAKKEADQLLREAKQKNETVEIERNGEKVEVEEKDLWREALSLKEGQAWDYLNDKYPEVFEAYEKHNELADELKKSFTEEFGFPLRAMSHGKFIKAVQHINESNN